jgi:hypothetical protein
MVQGLQRIAHPGKPTVWPQAIVTLVVLAVLYPLLGFPARGQEPDSFVFDDSSLPTVVITIDQTHLDDLFAPGNQYSDEERPAAFTFIRGLDTMRVDSVGFRFRGNTSRDSQKKSFKVSFNTFRPGQKFLGLEKLNLNGEHNDPSIMRSKIGWDLFQTMGIPASRANHVRLYLNDEYYGLYINVEHVDEQFLQRYFGNDQGNLYKCLWPADLVWLGPGADAYRPTNPERRPYDLKLKDSDLEGYDDLAHLIDIINNSAPSEFPSAIQSVFNVNGFLRVLAVTTLTGSWDSYWFLKNNFYLYSNPNTGLFEYLPFDFDNIMGIWWEGIYPGLDWAGRDVYNWGHPDPNEHRPLAERILAVPEFRERYTMYLKLLLAGPFAQDDLHDRILRLRSMVEFAAVEDSYRTLDYGYTVQDFYASYTIPLGGHVTHGLLPFVTERIRSAQGQIDAVDARPIVSDVGVVPPIARPGSRLRITARVEDEDDNPEVLLFYRLGSAAYQQVTMRREPVLGPFAYSAMMTAPLQPTTISLYISASDPIGQSTVTDQLTLSVLGEVRLFVNELMAANSTTIADANGEYDDWLELFNAGPEPVNVNGFTLTDDPLRPDKWALPDSSIAAGGFLLVWADEDGTQGPTHSNFRLSRLGEYLGLFDASGVPLDTLWFPPQVDDVSYGRSVDGEGMWVSQAIPTPGTSNSGAVGAESDAPTLVRRMYAFPNPFRSSISVAVEGARGGQFEVFDILGRRVAVHLVADFGRASFRLDDGTVRGSSLPAGVYTVRYTGDNGALVTSTVVRIR